MSTGYFESMRRSNPLTGLVGSWVEVIDPRHPSGGLRGKVTSAYTNHDGYCECCIEFHADNTTTALASQVEPVKESQ